MPDQAHVQEVNEDPLMSQLLSPLSKYYESEDTVEIRINRPGMVVTDRRGHGKELIEDPELTLAAIETICMGLANYNGLKFNADTQPKLSCVLREGHRFECLVGASVQSGVSLAIRCKHPFTPTWIQLGVSEHILEYLNDALISEKNMIVSGGTNTGKTTFMNKLLMILSDDERLIAVEDAPELFVERFWDGNGLLADREANEESSLVTYQGLYDHKMRITPGRIWFSEISTRNASAFLNALTAGVEGMMCSIHGNNPHQILNYKFEQLVSMAGDTTPNVSQVLKDTIDVVIQIKRDKDGYRRITDIYEPKNDRFVLKDGEEV